MKAIAATLVLFSVTPAVAQQCGKGQMPGPPGSGQCIQVCGPGYSIGKDASGFDTCLRDGNARLTTPNTLSCRLPPARTTFASASERMSASRRWSMITSSTWIGMCSQSMHTLRKLATRSTPG